ncbi:hypothetical protein J3459_008671 [Metarhizium acridum]|uniref:Uncharacterized protein n=1 Tax=Metarhizium acridum (strain CQMa 102) TaxID=655827 RepID=E9DX90_METAQ|nr:uncharacterized protein MAC_02238 [Metarhizium acridum CQMa 102]EFY91648.1 hypothetical protein MAC_02238 [Metarhizium acridum CQMa 102]KAG8409232.1 hypothetical protein J3458_019349 [Metarhizium acridum]KAG8425881.1 hypothetical protein J3459_008671 [Metarhizium acridum]
MNLPRLVTLLAVAFHGHAIAIIQPEQQGQLAGGGGETATDGAMSKRARQPSAQAIDNAARAWQRDTGVVSNFLSNAESMGSQQLQQQARIALSAENDELNHKAVLDQMFLKGSPKDRKASVRQANNVLDTQGTFQFVVDGLQTLSRRGARMSPGQVSSMVRAINQDRCPNVLPAIDSYMAAAAGAGQGGRALKAIRPTQC